LVGNGALIDASFLSDGIDVPNNARLLHVARVTADGGRRAADSSAPRLGDAPLVRAPLAHRRAGIPFMAGRRSGDALPLAAAGSLP
jgi:hypothetical protein